MNNKIQKGNVVTIDFAGDILSGQPYHIGNLTGVSIGTYSAGDVGGIDRQGVFDLDVQAADENGNSAIAKGDKIYINALHELSKDTTGVEFGVACGSVTAGQTDTIPVVLK